MAIIGPLDSAVQHMYSLRRYIQHEMAQYDYGYDEDEFDHPLSQPNWASQTRQKYIKLIIMNSTHTKDFKATSNKKVVVSERVLRGKRVHTPHSKMQDSLMSSVEVST